MKLISILKFLQFTLIFTCFVTSILSLNISTNKANGSPKTTPDPPENPSDAVHKRILDYINTLAEEKMKSSNMMAKKKIAGALPEGFPQDTIQRALDTRNDKRKWRQILGLPTELYRMCLFPFAKVNYVKWCNNNFFGAKNKGDSISFLTQLVYTIFVKFVVTIWFMFIKMQLKKT